MDKYKTFDLLISFLIGDFDLPLGDRDLDRPLLVEGDGFGDLAPPLRRGGGDFDEPFRGGDTRLGDLDPALLNGEVRRWIGDFGLSLSLSPLFSGSSFGDLLTQENVIFYHISHLILLIFKLVKHTHLVTVPTLGLDFPLSAAFASRPRRPCDFDPPLDDELELELLEPELEDPDELDELVLDELEDDDVDEDLCLFRSSPLLGRALHTRSIKCK